MITLYDTEEEYPNIENAESWVTYNNNEYFFAGKTKKKIPAGLYSIIFSDDMGFGLSQMNHTEDDIFMLPNLPYEEIINDFNYFWENTNKFKEFNLTPKRGIILHGKPGCGKSSLIYLLVKQIKEQNGIAIYMENPEGWQNVAKVVRKIEKKRPLLCIIEDMDIIIEKFGEEKFLNFLDGLNGIENIVYVATTNEYKKIPDRIKKRPSRFDKTYEIKHPKKDDRKYYIETKLQDYDISKEFVDKMVKDTEAFSIDQLKELIVSLYIYENNYNEAIERLKNANISDVKNIGFG